MKAPVCGRVGVRMGERMGLVDAYDACAVCVCMCVCLCERVCVRAACAPCRCFRAKGLFVRACACLCVHASDCEA